MRLLVSSGNGPGECRQAVGHILEALRREAHAGGIVIDIFEVEAKHGPSSAVVILGGAGARDMAARWVGVAQWKCQSTLRPRHKRKNWFVQIFELGESPTSLSIDESEVETQAIRAGGPGGQHVNKTASAIRARWVAPGGRVYSVVVRDQRSQHQNRGIAMDRLRALASTDMEVARAEQKGDTRYLHHQVERGNPSRTFEGPGFKEVGRQER